MGSGLAPDPRRRQRHGAWSVEVESRSDSTEAVNQAPAEFWTEIW